MNNPAIAAHLRQLRAALENRTDTRAQEREKNEDVAAIMAEVEAHAKLVEQAKTPEQVAAIEAEMAKRSRSLVDIYRRELARCEARP
jgi:hypothetical protein